MEIAKIIVGIDFSEQSEIAAKYAVQIARHTGARVILVHAGQVPEKPLPKNASARTWQAAVESKMAQDRDKLEDMRKRLGNGSPEISHMIIDGFADIGLCDAGKRLDADLIVTGTHGRSGLSRFLMGSVAERVVRHYHRHVMVARPGAEHKRAFDSILVPTDFSADAEAALRLALVLVAPGGAIELFHAWDTPPELALEWSGPVLDELAEDAKQAGKQLLQRYQSSERTIAFETARAGAVTGIEQRLQAREFDLVIMGSHGRRGIKRFLLGSVAEKIVRHAPCSVIVVHHHE